MDKDLSIKAYSQDFVHEGFNLAQAQGTPYQQREIPRILPTVVGGPGQLNLFLFLL